MCGLVATLGLQVPISGAVATLSHRGPDGSGGWRSPDGLLALGHRRLAVVGGPTATQPVAHRGIAAVLNGQLYGWRSLAAAHRVPTLGGDAGLLPALYRAHGDELGRALRGEFALVVADVAERRLLALRDPYGTKPLYWARIDGGVALASEVRALIALGVAPRLCMRALAHAFAHQYLPPGLSMVEGVGLVPPGGRLVAELGASGAVSEVRVDRWTTRSWPLSSSLAPGPPPTPAELVDALDDAVAVRLDSDRPVGALLSGGMDSAAIVDSAVRQAGPLPCFTLRFPGEGYDEGALARAIGAARGCPVHAVSVTHHDLLTHLPTAVASAEGVCINGQLVARRLLARAVRQSGVVVVLSGEGSDEVALGYPHLALDAGAGAGAVSARHAAQAGVMLPSGRVGGLGGLEGRLPHVPAFLRAKAGFGRRLLALADFQTVLRDVDPLAALAERLTDLPLHGRHPAHQASALWMELCLAGYILRGISDAQDMAEGVENRPPFLDPKVWSVARRVPVESQLVGADTKCFLRHALSDRLGPVAWRPKHPFLAPPLLGALSNDSRSSPAPSPRVLFDQVVGQLDGLADIPAVDRGRVQTWLEDTVATSHSGAELAARDAVLWTLLSTAALSNALRSEP